MNMEMTSEVIRRETGLDLMVSDSVILRNGRRAERAYINLGEIKLGVLLVEVNESFKILQEIKDLIQLAQYERVIIHTSHLLPEQMEGLKEEKIGFIDDYGHYFIPLEVVSSEAYSKESTRSSSMLNEFPLGFLFFKNYGLLELTQAEIGNLIGKSPATINIVLKRMQSENLIVKIEQGYHLANIENYFDRWCFIVSQYKNRKAYGKYSSIISDKDLKELQFKKLPERKWALSGPRIECLLRDGHLEHAEEFSIFMEVKSQIGLMKDLKLIPSSIGEITLYPTFIDLCQEGHFAHEIVISAELINSNNPRIKEAGKKRFEKYLREAKKVINERFGGRSF